MLSGCEKQWTLRACAWTHDRCARRLQCKFDAFYNDGGLHSETVFCLAQQGKSKTVAPHKLPTSIFLPKPGARR